MKKLLSLAAGIFVLFLLQGCGDEEDPTPSSSTLNPPEVLYTLFAGCEACESTATETQLKIQSIITNWGEDLTGRGVCWNTTGDPTIADSKTTDALIIGQQNSSIITLQKGNITYYFRAYATNAAGTSYGVEIEYTTPDVLTLGAISAVGTSEIGQEDATIELNITSLGTGSTYSDAGIYIGTNPTPTNSDMNFSVDGAINSTGTYYVSVPPMLTANTTYYVKAYFENEAGIVYSNIISFTTNP